METHSVKITNKIKRVQKNGVTHLNNYAVGKLIGEGPYAKIKLLTDLQDDNKPYAMKKFTLYLLRKKTRMIRDKDGKNKYISIVEDVQAQTDLMIPLNHPNIIKLHEIMRTVQKQNPNQKKKETEKEKERETVNQKLYLVMQYCKLGPVTDWDSKKHSYKTLPEILQPKRLTNIIIGILEGLKYLHDNNVMHRDLKPANILLDQNYVPKIIDFGRAVKLIDKDQLLKGSEGTYHFMAPEMLSEKQKSGYDARKSDIWSVGVTIYCMVTLTLPFDAEPIIKLFQAIQKSEFQYPVNVSIPEHVKRIIDGCITHHPVNRLSIDKMLQICQQYLNKT